MEKRALKIFLIPSAIVTCLTIILLIVLGELRIFDESKVIMIGLIFALGCVILVAVILCLIYTKFRKKESENYTLGNLRITLDYMLKQVGFFPFKKMLLNQDLHLNIAVIHLRLGERESFECEIKEIQHDKLLALKFFWITFALLKEDNIREAKESYKLFLESPRSIHKRSYEFYNSYLLNIFDYFEDRSEVTRERMREFSMEIKNPFMLDYYSKLIGKERNRI